MFLIFEMRHDVEVIIVQKDSQYAVVKNSVIEDRWILILQITDEATPLLEFPHYKWSQELFYAIDLILEHVFY